MGRTDSDIVAAYRSGEHEAFNELVSRYMSRIYSFAYRLSHDTALAEDATAETFIKAWKKLDTFDTDKSFAAWLFAIARNNVFDGMRKKRDVNFSHFSEDNDLAESIADDRDSAEIEFDREISKTVLEESLAQLSLIRRSVVVLHDIDGMTFEEIAVVLGMPMNTAKSHYRRALVALKAYVHQKGTDKRI